MQPSVEINDAPETYIKESKIHGYGLFASKKFYKGDVIAQFGNPNFWKKKDYYNLSEEEKERRWFVPLDNGQCLITDKRTNFSFINNSTAPNAFINFSNNWVVALREIKKDEEITIDYTAKSVRNENLAVFQNLVLVGFMGCGKSSVGCILASLTGFDFVDTDVIITQKTRKLVTHIIQQQGEAHFRELEGEVLENLVEHTGQIVSTGGGIITVPKNAKILPQMGPVVWLDARIEVIYERIKTSDRVILTQSEDPLRRIEEVYRMREPLYRDIATIRVDSSELTEQQIAETVLSLLKQQ
jgi:shikimate kinase